MAISCEPADLTTAAKCFTCVPRSMQKPVELYLLAVAAGLGTDYAAVQAMVTAAKCMTCVPRSMWEQVELYLLCLAAGGGGASGESGVTSGSGAPVAAPSGTCGLYIDTDNGLLYTYYLGAWH